MPAWLWWLLGALLAISLVLLGLGIRKGRRAKNMESRLTRHSRPLSLELESRDSPISGYSGSNYGERSSGLPALSPKPIGDDNVQFTVYRPRAVKPGPWYTLLAFAHLATKRPGDSPQAPDPVQEVRHQAHGLLGDAGIRAYQSTTQDSTASVPHRETITLIPDVPGLEFNPPSRSFRWTESFHREEFRFQAAQDRVGQIVRGRLSVFLGTMLLADVVLAIAVQETVDDIPEEAQPHEASKAGRYRKVFASYSHKDLQIVEQFEHFAKALGDEYLRDWKNLRAGEVWNERLLKMIEEADVFQLFWSRNSMQSDYVRQEYEHALGLNRVNFIRPTYWEEPLPTDPEKNLPPETLLKLHFQRIVALKEPPDDATCETQAPELVMNRRFAKKAHRIHVRSYSACLAPIAIFALALLILALLRFL